MTIETATSATIGEAEPEFTFMTIRAEYRGHVENERFFLSRLPEPGEAVEMVFVGNTADGDMKFQLRTRAE